ncbi:hypothetical protein CLV99_0249 [Sphingobacterium yanglingense]|uniref:Uncharacterized protein n=1 Tax=Sphingobacterium yanglingense TaxID=1437280 RepID=A0A4V3DEJ2_9SPHI|nr:hypothetical protein CLV99_0249 [Sphingobacterium yanglingense]
MRYRIMGLKGKHSSLINHSNDLVFTITTTAYQHYDIILNLPKLLTRNRERVFALESLQYAKVLQRTSGFPDSV